MFKTMRIYLIGFLSATLLLTGAAYATGTTTLYDVIIDGIRIVLDGKEFTCTDANGSVVKPMIYNGTTYIPARAVSSAFGKAVYWDGEEKTVYLGNMDGKLEKPTLRLEDIENIADNKGNFSKEQNIFDNYNNFYGSAVLGSGNTCCETLLNKKYSKFKATLLIPKGTSWASDKTYNISIIGDDKILFTSNEMSKTSQPIDVEIDITNVNNFKILFGNISLFDYHGVCIANGGFFQ